MNIDPKTLLERYEPRPVQVIEPDRQLSGARFSPCGRFLVGGDFDARIRRWDVSSVLADVAYAPKPDDLKKRRKGNEPLYADLMPELPPLEGHHGWVDAFAFAPAGEWLYTADSWGGLNAWAYAEERPQPKWSVAEAHDGWIHDLAVSPDGSRIVTCGNDRVVRIWSLEDGSKLEELFGHEHDVHSLCFSPDGSALLSGDLFGVVKQWELATGKVTRKFDAGELYSLSRLQDVGGVRLMRFDPTGRFLICAGTRPKNGGNVQGAPLVLIFDWQTGEQKQALELGAVGDVYVRDLQFHADGFLMAVTSGNPGTGQLLFRRLEDDKPFYLNNKLSNCHSLSVHPTGRKLAVSTTSRGSNGNGRKVDADGNYVGNTSPIHIFDLP